MKRMLLAILLCNAAIAGSPEQYAAGRGSLKALLQNEPLFLLTPTYKGSVSLVHHHDPRDKDVPKQRELHFTAFAPDGSRYGEPDCPHPKLPAVFEASPLEGHGYSTDVFAFSESAPAVERLAACTTLKDLRAAVPNLVHVFSEDEARPGYWYNWFYLADDGQLHVTLLSVGDDENGKLIRMEIWAGTIPLRK
jgi:hypothetical protein